MNVVWSGTAIRHLIALREYIAKDDPRAAQRVGRRILDSVEVLTKQPHIGRPGRVAGTRELAVPGTSYVIPYRIRAGRLEIIAVFHGRQKWPATLA